MPYNEITKLAAQIFRYMDGASPEGWGGGSPAQVDCWAWLGRAAGPGVPCLGAWLAARAIPFRARAPYNEINDLEISLLRYMAAV